MGLSPVKSPGGQERFLTMAERYWVVSESAVGPMLGLLPEA